ncbi:hypothetical protein LY90DRAFT_177889 [Neocallimastix californiae]|jgi:hypothetical protein|uniref:C3H1-type domain-containing protein n=1 Tax=Neocallimastix californiae TaxID=1754190 RepID=A0A1Y1ZY38_9FUNG|nr:hypothetical protein LY90DRAFT_177889 [Neocallimastix californiae]|eukprot:ORY15100.1 hypothetical protein LY90DRAFT_177889 [Neocallimastix californiae]
MKRQTTQSKNNLPPRINTPNNPDFIKDYFSGGQHPLSPFSPSSAMDNNMFNNMYFPNNQMLHANSPMYKTVDAIENYDVGDGNKNKTMVRGISSPNTPIHPMNEVNQFNIPIQQFRNGYEMYGDPQQPLMTPPPYMRGNGPFMNGGHHGKENMMGMNHLKDRNNNLLSPVVMENTGGAQNNKKANLYKTELCRSFEETGHCRYGSKCQFAHSESELRHVERHPKYKTEMCKTFWELGTCPYGKRCCFIHTLREDAPGRTTPSTPTKNIEKKTLPDANATINLSKKKENTSETTNNLSEGETIAVTSEEGENTGNNRSRSDSGSTAASITEEVISTAEKDDQKNQDESNKDSEGEKETSKNEDKKEGTDKNESDTATSITNSKDQTKTTGTAAVTIKTNNNIGNKGIASSFDAMTKTPTTNQTFNYSTSVGGSIMNNGNSNGVQHRKMSTSLQRQNPRMNTSKLSADMNNYNGILGMNSMSYQPNSPLDPEFMFNGNDKTGINGMSTSFPTNPDFLDDKTMMKLQNLNIHTSLPHTPINGQRTPQSNQGVMSPLSSSFNQNFFMKQPLNVSTAQNSSNLFLKQTTGTASPFASGTPNSFLSPKQTHMGLPGIPPLMDDETGSFKGSVSGKGSDFGDETRSNATEEASTTSSVNNSNNLFVKQAISAPKPGTPQSFLKVSQKPSTPNNPSFLPSTPQSISTGFLLNNGSASPLPSNRMGTSLPSTPIHPNNSFNPSAIEDIFNGNNTIINDFSRSTGSGINVAASPFTPSNDLSQYMVQMASARENSAGIQSLENIKSPSQLFYRPTSNSISAINTTPSAKSNGGFGSMTMGGIGMGKFRSESIDYGMLSPNGFNSFLSGGNPVSSPVNAFNNSLASSFSNSFLANKMRSESVDFGQLGSFNNKENSLVGSLPSIPFISKNEGIPDSPFSNHGSMHGSPLPSTTNTTTLNDMSGGMENFMNGGRRKSFPESSLMPNRLPTVPEGRHPKIVEEEEEHLFNNNNLTDEGILKFSKEHFGLDDAHSKSLLGGQGSGAMDINGSILGGSVFSPMSPSSNLNNFF